MLISPPDNDFWLRVSSVYIRNKITVGLLTTQNIKFDHLILSDNVSVDNFISLRRTESYTFNSIGTFNEL